MTDVRICIMELVMQTCIMEHDMANNYKFYTQNQTFCHTAFHNLKNIKLYIIIMFNL